MKWINTAVLAVVALTGGVTHAEAQTQTLYDPGVLAIQPDAGFNREWQVRPDGTGTMEISYLLGDLSRIRFGPLEKRYFIACVPRDTNSTASDILVRDEDNTTETVMATDETASLTRSLSTGIGVDTSVHWSPDGTRIMYAGSYPAPGGGHYRRNILVGDVVLDANGLPAAVVNERVAVDTGTRNVSDCVWMGDGQRIAVLDVNASQMIIAMVPLPNEPATIGTAVNVANLPGGLTRLTASPADDRIALRAYNPKNGRRDIYTVEIPSGYSGTLLQSFQVTDSRNAKVMIGNGKMSFSPDGQHIAYETATSTGGSGRVAVYRNATDKSGTQSLLIGKRSYDLYLKYWR